jgi:hypothetical protein
MPQAAATATPTPPSPPTTPQAAAQGIGEIVRTTVNDAVAGVLAETRADLQQRIIQLEARREGLTAALKNVGSRPARAVIESQLDEVNRELAKTQSALDKINAKLTTTDGPVRVFTSTAPPAQFPGFPEPHFNPAPMIIAIVSIIFIGFPLALTMSRWLWKRSTNAPAPPLTVEQTRRFDRLEQSVDAIAIEVERISENQRYLTKLLAEPKQSAKIGS